MARDAAPAELLDAYLREWSRLAALARPLFAHYALGRLPPPPLVGVSAHPVQGWGPDGCDCLADCACKFRRLDPVPSMASTAGPERDPSTVNADRIRHCHRLTKAEIVARAWDDSSGALFDGWDGGSILAAIDAAARGEWARVHVSLVRVDANAVDMGGNAQLPRVAEPRCVGSAVAGIAVHGYRVKLGQDGHGSCRRVASALSRRRGTDPLAPRTPWAQDVLVALWHGDIAGSESSCARVASWLAQVEVEVVGGEEASALAPRRQATARNGDGTRRHPSNTRQGRVVDLDLMLCSGQVDPRAAEAIHDAHGVACVGSVAPATLRRLGRGARAVCVRAARIVTERSLVLETRWGAAPAAVVRGGPLCCEDEDSPQIDICVVFAAPSRDLAALRKARLRQVIATVRRIALDDWQWAPACGAAELAVADDIDRYAARVERGRGGKTGPPGGGASDAEVSPVLETLLPLRAHVNNDSFDSFGRLRRADAARALAAALRAHVAAMRRPREWGARVDGTCDWTGTVAALPGAVHILKRVAECGATFDNARPAF
jgi:hypothetical protein